MEIKKQTQKLLMDAFYNVLCASSSSLIPKSKNPLDLKNCCSLEAKTSPKFKLQVNMYGIRLIKFLMHNQPKTYDPTWDHEDLPQKLLKTRPLLPLIK